jgi:predicted alpha/beta-fold hydrolase
VLVGYSLGGNVVLKLLGEGEFPVAVRAAATVSAPIDLAATSKHFLRLRNYVYHRWLIGRMRTDALATPGLEAHWAERVRSSQSVWDFDDRFIAPRHGYDDAAHYYRVNSAAQFVARIQVPTLAIHALDDPWIPSASYRSIDWAKVPAVKALLPRSGGHVGFHAIGGVWHDRCLVRFFERLAG